MEINEIIRGLREDKNLKQIEIAKILKTTQSYYGQYERGIRQIPIIHLKTLCEFYNVSADYIIGLPEGMPYPKR